MATSGVLPTFASGKWAAVVLCYMFFACLNIGSVLVEFRMKFLQNGSPFPGHFVDMECNFCHFLTELATVKPYFIVEKSLTIV